MGRVRPPKHVRAKGHSPPGMNPRPQPKERKKQLKKSMRPSSEKSKNKKRRNKKQPRHQTLHVVLRTKLYQADFTVDDRSRRWNSWSTWPWWRGVAGKGSCKVSDQQGQTTTAKVSKFGASLAWHAAVFAPRNGCPAQWTELFVPSWLSLVMPGSQPGSQRAFVDRHGLFYGLSFQWRKFCGFTVGFIRACSNWLMVSTVLDFPRHCGWLIAAWVITTTNQSSITIDEVSNPRTVKH